MNTRLTSWGNLDWHQVRLQSTSKSYQPLEHHAELDPRRYHRVCYRHERARLHLYRSCSVWSDEWNKCRQCNNVRLLCDMFVWHDYVTCSCNTIMWHVCLTCLCVMFVSHVCVTCSCDTFTWHICVTWLCDTCVCDIFMCHVNVACLCDLFVWHVCVTCLCHMSVWCADVTCLCDTWYGNETLFYQKDY